MKTAKKKKAITPKPAGKKPKAKSNMKATFGILKWKIIEAPDLWTEDL